VLPKEVLKHAMVSRFTCIWYLLSPWIFKAASAAMWNGIIVGIIVAICAYMFPAEKSWQKWLGVLMEFGQ